MGESREKIYILYWKGFPNPTSPQSRAWDESSKIGKSDPKQRDGGGVKGTLWSLPPEMGRRRHEMFCKMQPMNQAGIWGIPIWGINNKALGWVVRDAEGGPEVRHGLLYLREAGQSSPWVGPHSSGQNKTRMSLRGSKIKLKRYLT